MKTVIIITLSLMCAGAAHAQTTQEPNVLPKSEVITDSIGHVLDLTNDQMKRVQVIDARYAELPAAKANLEMRDKDLRSVLSPSQFTQWNKLRKEISSGVKKP